MTQVLNSDLVKIDFSTDAKYGGPKGVYINAIIKWDKNQYVTGEKADGIMGLTWRQLSNKKVRFSLNLTTPHGIIPLESDEKVRNLKTANGSFVLKLSDLLPNTFPYELTEKEADGQYKLIFTVTDENRNPLSEDTDYFEYLHESLRSMTSINMPLFYNYEQPTVDDLKRIPFSIRDVLHTLTAILFGGQSGIIYGMGLKVKTIDGKKALVLEPGVATQVTKVKDEEVVSSGGVAGSQIIVNEKEYIVGYYEDHMPISGQGVMYDPVMLKFQYTPSGKEFRRFIDPDTGEILKRDEFTRVQGGFSVIWSSGERVGNEDSLKAWQDWLLIGHVKIDPEITEETFSDDQVSAKTFDPFVLSQHKNTFDHPDKSVHANHLSDTVKGDGYQGSAGGDLNLKQMSGEIKTARGTTDSIESRIGKTIDHEGNLVFDVVQDAIKQILQDLLGGIIDDQGYANPAALDEIVDGSGNKMLYQISIAVGSDTDDPSRESRMQIDLPAGFTSYSDCVYIVSPSSLVFEPAANKSLNLLCQAHDRSKGTVLAGVERWSAGVKDATWQGTFNYLIIGLKGLSS